MGSKMSKTVEDPTALTKMALAAIIGSKARRLAEYAQNGDFKNFRENFGKYPLLGTRDYTIFVIYVSMFVCAAITKDESEEAQEAKKLAKELLDNMHTARSFFNFGLGVGSAIYENLIKMSKFKKFLNIMSNGKYINGYDSAFGKRIKHIIPWMTKTSKTALQTLAVPAMKALFGTNDAATKFKQGVQKMGEEYVTTEAATAINDILESYTKDDLFTRSILKDLSDIRIKEDYLKLQRYSKLLMDGKDIEASYLSGTYFPLMKDLTELFAKGLKSHKGSMFSKCKCNDPNTLAYGLERLLTLDETTVLTFEDADAPGLKDKNYRRLVNFIINHLCKSKVLAKIDEESEENFAEELRKKYIKTYEIMFPISAKIHAATEKLKSKFSRNKTTHIDDDDSDIGDDSDNDEEGSSTTTGSGSETVAADPDKDKLDALCAAVKKVTLDELDYKGSEFEARMSKKKYEFDAKTKEFGKKFADSKGTTFAQKVGGTFWPGDDDHYYTWENIFHIVWLRYAAKKCEGDVLQFVDDQLESLTLPNIGEAITYAKNKKIVTAELKFKKAASAPAADDDKGSSTTGSAVTTETPFNVDELKKIAEQIQSFNIDSDLPGLEQSQHFAEWAGAQTDDTAEGKAKKVRAKIKTRLENIQIRLQNVPVPKQSDKIDNYLENVAFKDFKAGDSYHTFNNEIAVMILAIAGHKAHIEQIYDRLINTLIRSDLDDWGEKPLRTIADQYFDTSTFTLKKNQA